MNSNLAVIWVFAASIATNFYSPKDYQQITNNNNVNFSSDHNNAKWRMSKHGLSVTDLNPIQREINTNSCTTTLVWTCHNDWEYLDRTATATCRRPKHTCLFVGKIICRKCQGWKIPAIKSTSQLVQACSPSSTGGQEGPEQQLHLHPYRFLFNLAVPSLGLGEVGKCNTLFWNSSNWRPIVGLL